MIWTIELAFWIWLFITATTYGGIIGFTLALIAFFLAFK